MRRTLRLLSVFALLVACRGSERDPESDLFATVPDVEPIVQTSNLGPVRAEVRLRPSMPRLGDVVTLELKVTAPSAVDIVMPEFGEALGRFSIVDYDWRESREGDELTREQLYQLQVAASGKQRLPQLRIEVTDRRPDAEATGETRELLTDEVLIDVAPIEIAPGDNQMKPNLGTIEIKPLRPWHSMWFWWALAAVVVVLGFVIGLHFVKRAKVATRVSAYDRALAQLAQLRAAGLPAGDEVDAWYVELSSIVRHYLEGRFSVRAPELTTEEFLREAQRSPDLTGPNRQMLGDFLAGCDRVKFAGHRPSEAEQNEALESALRFVEDTRPLEAAA